MLDKDQKRQLDRLGFEWTSQKNRRSSETKKSTITSSHGSQWDEKFAELQQFREAKGHCSVTEEENPSLAVWVERQRCVFRHNILAECRIEQLESIDFCFVPVAKRGNIDEDDDDSHESADKPQDKIEYHEKKRSSPMALKSVDRKKPRTSSSGRRKQGHEKPVDPTVPRPSVPASSHTRVSPSSPSRGKVIYGARRQIRFGTMVELENTIGPKQYEFSYEDGTTETLSAQEAQEALNLGESEKSKYIGKRIAKTFDGQPFMGTIVSYRDGGDVTYWKVDYDDGDSEEFDIKDVNKYMKFFDYIGLMH
uniref:Helicase-associated domain-containing protein n=1 Tax=Grammatophora oceanica TaxID=210454 RepID=A0A7S1VRJ4_9STRA